MNPMLPSFLNRFLFAASLLTPFASSQAAIVLVDFGSTNSGLTGYNEITSLASMSTPVSLVTKTGTNSGITLSYSGASANTSAGNGVTTAFPRSLDTEDAWSAITGGEALSTVNEQGLGFGTASSARGNFTLSGLTIGESYSLMLLFGAGGTGNGSTTVFFTGIEDDYSHTGYDLSAGKTATYNSTTSTLNFGGHLGSGQAGSLVLNFTAADEDLLISIGGPPIRSAIQAIALVPEPTTALLGGIGIIPLLRRRRAS